MVDKATTELSADDRLLLAREVACDKHLRLPLYYTHASHRQAFHAGWDAAMEWIAKERQRESKPGESPLAD